MRPPFGSEDGEALPRAGGEDGQGRARLFDSIAAFVRNTTRTQPAVLILDDLQWADRPSLLLLQFLVREVRGARLLIIGTYRDVDLDRAHPLSQMLGELARSRIGRRLSLDGLSEADVARLIEITTAAPPSPALVGAVHGKTEGNAFFVTETVRLLAADGRLAAQSASGSWTLTIPQGVREVVIRRLAHLSDACLRILTAASVSGREFELDVVARVSGQDGGQVLDLLAEAEAARIVAEVPAQIGRFSFTHALIREALYEELSPTRRVRLHRQTGEALEAVHAANVGPRLAELAHHFFEAVPAGELEKAVHYARRAGDRALALLAYEEAARHYELALRALDLDPERAQHSFPAGAGPLRCELLLALGDAHNKADDIATASESFRQAAKLARDLGDPERLARAALGFADVEPAPGAVNTEKVELLEQALYAMERGDSALKARVLARLALELYFGDVGERTTALGRAAVAMARRADDPGALAYALHAERMVIGWTDRPEDRLAVATEITGLAEQAGDADLAITGQFWRLADLLEMGDIQAADAQIEVCHQQAEALRQPVWRWYAALTRAMRAMLDGRFAEAEQLAHQALAMGQRTHGTTALQTYGGQLLVIRRDQGRLAELEPIVQSMAAQNPTVPAWHAALAFLHAELGREAEARASFDQLASQDFRDLPHDVLYLVLLTVLTETCAFLGDAPRAAMLYDLLLPYAGRNLVLANALACMGSCSYYLGLLAGVLEREEGRGNREEEATWRSPDSSLFPLPSSLSWEEHFHEALRMHSRMRARPWLARTQHAYAALLLRRDGLGDRERAALLLARALDTAQALGMQRLGEQIGTLIAKQ